MVPWGRDRSGAFLGHPGAGKGQGASSHHVGKAPGEPRRTLRGKVAGYAPGLTPRNPWVFPFWVRKTLRGAPRQNSKVHVFSRGYGLARRLQGTPVAARCSGAAVAARDVTRSGDMTRDEEGRRFSEEAEHDAGSARTQTTAPRTRHAAPGQGTGPLGSLEKRPT